MEKHRASFSKSFLKDFLQRRLSFKDFDSSFIFDSETVYFHIFAFILSWSLFSSFSLQFYFYFYLFISIFLF